MGIEATASPGINSPEPFQELQWDKESFCRFQSLHSQFGTTVQRAEYSSSEKVGELWQKVWNQKDPIAMVTLADMYTQGTREYHKDFPKAFSLVTQAADLKNADAMPYLAWMCCVAVKNKAAEVEISKAIERFKAGVLIGDPGAMYALGYMYRVGPSRENEQFALLNCLGVSSKGGPEQEQGERLITEAARLGNSQAMAVFALNKLWRFELSGDKAVVSDADYWLEKVERTGNFVGCRLLSRRFLRSGDVDKGMQWLKKAVEAGDRDSMASLAGWYQSGGRGISKNMYEAISLYEKIAEQGSFYVKLSLAGISCEAQRGKEAVQWFQDALQDYAIPFSVMNAMKSIADLYETGLNDLYADQKQALLWSQRAGELGDVFALEKAAHRFRDGSGVPKDKREALRWARLADAEKRGLVSHK